MWLLPLFPVVGSFAARTFYQLSVGGATVPRRGPVLLAANHANSLLDPFLVMVAARRPVRFLAKSPLFEDRLSGWAVRAVGAIPVYRRRDDPSHVTRNEEMFRAVHAALEEGSAVGIFPEGISHDYPALAPFKTGAARIALGVAQRTGAPVPIVPIGLVFEGKQEFRSRAYALVGDPVQWADLAGLPATDPEAVRVLTGRIEKALHAVTVNYRRREDAALVAMATEIYAAEFGRESDTAATVARRAETARLLAELHLEGDPEAAEISRIIERHSRALALLGLTPSDLHGRTDVTTAFRWTLRRFSPLAIATAIVATAGVAVFWVPYRLTRFVAARTATAPDTIAMHKLVAGGGIFAGWILLLAATAGTLLDWWAALLAAAVLPALALASLSYGERWVGALRDIRRFFVLRTRGGALHALRERQRRLAERLRALYARADVSVSPV